MATIDYLAKGGDYMKAFREGDGVADSPTWVYDDLLEYFTTGAGAGRPLTGDPEPRWRKQ